MNTDLLKLLYNRVYELDKDRVAVIDDEKRLRIIDESNNTLFEKDSCEDCIVSIKGSIFVLRTNGRYEGYDSHTYSKSNLYYIRMDAVSDKGFIVEDLDGSVALINTNNEKVIEPIFGKIWLYRKTSMADWFRVKPYGVNIREDYELSEIRVEKDYTKADGIYAYNLGIPELDIVIVSDTIYGKRRVRLRNNSEIVSKEYSDIVKRRALINHGMLQVFNECTTGGKKGYLTGYIDFKGNEIVNPKYLDVEYIGNGITIVKDENGYGTVVNGNEVIQTGKINKCSLYDKIPMSITIVDGVQFFIGNDGHAYSNVKMAFPIYISTVLDNLYLMCLYGNWIYIDENFNVISEKGLPAEAKDNTKWTKL